MAEQEHHGGRLPWPGCPSCHTLTVESRAPVANMRSPGAQEHAQMTRACAFITLPTSLNGCSPADPLSFFRQLKGHAVLKLFILAFQNADH